MEKRKALQDAEVASKTIERGVLIVHTGPGKGKTTAAWGLTLRTLGHGWRVGVVQFIKGAWETGERTALARFGDQVSWHTLGEGFTWETQDKARDIAAAQAAWAKARELMAATDIRLLVIGVLKNRREDLTVVATGRNAKPDLIAAADCVTEMGAVKHHFAAGFKAQEGIEF
jgi:cob(I)alamin adenosyltransferase